MFKKAVALALGLSGAAVLVIAAAAFGATASLAQTYNPGDHVEAYSSMSGKWEKAVIVRPDGAMSDGRARYFVHAEDPGIVNAYWGSTADQLRAAPPAGAPAIPAPDGQAAPAGQ